MSRWEDMTGWKMWEHGVPDSRLTVVSYEGIQETLSGKRRRMWKCLCTCGNITYSCTQYLKDGTKKSCGCFRRENTARFNIETKTKHHEGRTNSRLYTIWGNMKARCCNKNNAAYKNYGGRGITVCQEWQNDYATFKSWAINNGYSDNLTIDRIDVDGDYNPSNCRWTSWTEQENNKTTNINIEYSGEIHTLSEWARIFNIKPGTLRRRLLKKWSVKDAFETPVRKWCKKEDV